MDRRLADFIMEHSGDDPIRLLLSRDRWPDIDMDMAATAIECRRKIVGKLPEWYSESGIIYPDRICVEQSSSSDTAKYKADVAARIISATKAGIHPRQANVADGQKNRPAMDKSGRIADLTGGLGVDSIAFSRVSEQVLYNDVNAGRAEAAAHNFHLLGAGNIQVIIHSVCPETVDLAGSQPSDICPDGSIWSILRNFRPDLIYMDPARRSESGRKVFLPEDCSPDVLTLIPDLFKVTRNLLLKLSPMADISVLVNRFRESGAVTEEVHVVASGGECKELLLWLVPATDTDTNISGLDDSAQYMMYINENGHVLSVRADTESLAVPSYFRDEQELMRMAKLYVPGRALVKAGLFRTVCSLCGVISAMRPGQTDICRERTPLLLKAGRSTHLYFLPQEEDSLDAECFDLDHRDIPESLSYFGNIYDIVDIQLLDRQGVREFSRKYPHAEVTARNVPMTSDELRKRLHASGGDVRIFAFRADFMSGKSVNYMIACKKASLLSDHPSVK